ncbi:hypothetical protein FNV43_RR24738 [Rhamnella rubrinervis]|uniref:Tripeptidyl peptidase II second Ig-like domain-containing protein n=1 Tax=Rhamnella rubrinervis TaxID=2594499 RepID=A0A8K0DTN8_9ROSA|nr:hypothetical protein FNV43_RR24738 [Rhamnella rubrinervis]
MCVDVFILQVRVPYQPIEAKLFTLASSRDKLPLGKQILALILTYKFKLEDGAEVKPYIPLLNDCIYDTEFESQFYMISDANKEGIQLSFFSKPDGPSMGFGSYKPTVLVLGILNKDLYYSEQYPTVDEDKGKCPSPTSTKSVSEHLQEEVRDAKIKVLFEHPKYTPLLAKILEGLVSRSNVEDKFCHDEEVIKAANEFVDSIDTYELAKYLVIKSDPEDEEAKIGFMVVILIENQEEDGDNP